MHPITYFIDESIHNSEIGSICALIAVKVVDEDLLKRQIESAITKIISNPIYSLHKTTSEENWIPHFCEDHPHEVHLPFLLEMANMQFEAYIVYGIKEQLDGALYYDWYDKLLNVLMKFRFSADKDRISKVVFEQHESKIKKREAEISCTINKIARAKAKKERYCFSMVNVQTADKKELILSLCDYVGGAFMKYVTNPSDKPLGPVERKFLAVSKKVRWIKDISHDKIYTSKNPFGR